MAEQRMWTVTGARLEELVRKRGLPESYARDVQVVTRVLPFKVNNYVIDALIDWSRVPDDPIFRLTFPHRDMLPPHLYERIAKLLTDGAERELLDDAIRTARLELNPHPGAQLQANVPWLDGCPVPGLQHKYRETLLVFPAKGQTCHAYCGYCFRWAQFVGMPELHQALRDPQLAVAYLRRHSEITDVLFTGGDPLIMGSRLIAEYVKPLLEPGLDHVRTLRFGTKVLSYWPYRFTTDTDAPELLRLLERCVASGRHVAIMAHFSHPRELITPAVREAIYQLRKIGVVIRSQAPLVAHVNDNPDAWASLWQLQVELGIMPYYLFVERDTGSHEYFKVPLARVLEIYQQALGQVSGLARTARGPVMSTTAGKVLVEGIAWIGSEAVFVLSFLQARKRNWIRQPFFARFDERAAWFDELKPMPGSESFFDKLS